MELLPQGQRNNTQVTFKDQQKINEFSKLIMRKDAIAQELTLQREEKEYLDDVSLEIELIGEDEPVQYKVGDLFIFMKPVSYTHLDVYKRQVESDDEI